MKLTDSLTYVPVELKFGTSGLRALVSEMTDLECYINTRGFIDYLKIHNGIKDTSEILLAGDLRESTPRIMRVLATAVSDAGFSLQNCGLVPTPTAALLGYAQQKPCIVVTGSHIPADRNGIKYYKKEGEVLKSDEPLIKDCVSKIRAKLYGQDAEASQFNDSGSLKNLPRLPAVNSQAEEQFLERYKTLFDNKPLSSKH